MTIFVSFSGVTLNSTTSPLFSRRSVSTMGGEVISDKVDRLEMCQHQVEGGEGILPNSTFEVNSISLSSCFFEPLKSARLSKVKVKSRSQKLRQLTT
jgi:hypothetical protein